MHSNNFPSLSEELEVALSRSWSRWFLSLKSEQQQSDDYVIMLSDFETPTANLNSTFHAFDNVELLEIGCAGIESSIDLYALFIFAINLCLKW